MTLALAAAPAASGPPAAEVIPQMIMVLGVVMMAALIVISIRGKVARRTSPSAREMIDEIKARAGRPAERHASAGHVAAGAAGAELTDLARQLSSQLDNKAARLEQLIAEADQRINVLEQGHAPTPMDDALDIAPPPTPEPEPRPELDPLTRSVHELADAGHDPVAIAQRLDEQVGKVQLILALRGRG